MYEKTRKQLDKDRANKVNPAEFGVKVLSAEEIRKLYPGVPVVKLEWTEEHRNFMQRRNLVARKKSDSKKKALPYFEK